MTDNQHLERGEDQIFADLTRSEFEVVRLKAVQALRDTGATGQADALIAALMDEDEDVREDAAGALGQLGVQAAIPQLMANLKDDPCGEVKLACMKSLAALEAREAIPLFRTMVTGRNDDFTWDEDAFHTDEWDDWLDVQNAAITALGNMQDEGAIELIVQALFDEEGQELGPIATRALAKIGEASLPTLGVLLGSTRRRLRLQSLTAIASIGGKDAAELVHRALNEKDGDIRLLAYETLLEWERDSKLLMRAMEDELPKIRIAAFAKLELDDEMLLGRIVHDPSADVRLAMIDRLDLSTDCDDTEDLRFVILEKFAETDSGEVAARSFAALASIAPELMAPRLATLFAHDGTQTPVDTEELERMQWAVVDALARSPLPEGAEWLQKACRSPFRAVRLKALAALGQFIDDPERPHVTRQQVGELLLSLALPPAPAEMFAVGESGEPEEEVVNEADEIHKESLEQLEAAGLDISTDVPEDTGPTSSLGAILGHEEIAQELADQAAAENENIELNNREQALLSQARKTISRGKVSLDGNADDLARESRLTAIHLLGSHADMQSVLCSLYDAKDSDIAETVLAAMCTSVARFGRSVSEDQLSGLLDNVLGSTESAVRLQALRLMVHVEKPNERQMAQLRLALRDGDAHVRMEALSALLSHGKPAKVALPLLQDQSFLVRQKAMLLLCEYAPDLASEYALDFLLAHPDQPVDSYLPVRSPSATVLRPELHTLLDDPEMRAKWPLAIGALVALTEPKVELENVA